MHVRVTTWALALVPAQVLVQVLVRAVAQAQAVEVGLLVEVLVLCSRA